MRAVLFVLSFACMGLAPLPTVNLSVRVTAVPSVVRSGLEARIDVTPVNNGDEVRKHKLTGHVSVVRVMAERGGSEATDLRLIPGSAPGWVCAEVRFGLNCYTDTTFEPGLGPRIPLTVRAAAAGNYRVCAEISSEGRKERSPADNRVCATTSFVPPVDTQTDS